MQYAYWKFKCYHDFIALSLKEEIVMTEIKVRIFEQKLKSWSFSSERVFNIRYCVF